MRFNDPRRLAPRPGTAVITGPGHPTGRTAEGGPGYARTEQSELFLLGVANLVGQDTFYERAEDRDARFLRLVRATTTSDPQWTAEFLRWLRLGANMRSAALVGGIEAARTLAERQGAGCGRGDITPRQIAASVMQRADEPGEALGYWHTTYGRKLPKWFKRALGDAARLLYTPYTYLKWDSDRRAIRFADVIELGHLKRSQGDESGLFRYILDARPGASRSAHTPDPGVCEMFAAREALMRVDESKRRSTLLHPQAGAVFQKAGMTWEATAGWLQGVMDGPVWTRMVELDLLPYGALLRNLANMERAGISADAAAQVVAQLTDPNRIAKSRLMPMAFLTAYLNTPGDTFRAALDRAATCALGNIPRFDGRTLILIDTSGSMASPVSLTRDSRTGTVPLRSDTATLFGLALAGACQQPTIVSFAGEWGPGSKLFHPRAGENLLCAAARFRKTHFLGGGTDTAAAVRQWFARHDRVVCLTDEQAVADGHGVYSAVPSTTPVYTFNLAGYQYGHAASTGRRYTVGCLNDAAFTMMASLETYAGGRWPWQM